MQQRTILIVDNEKAVANALKRTLWKEGYRTLTATSGSEALTVLETFDCQVILADQRMPEMTGFEIFNRIKAKYPETIRILITAQIGEEDLKDLMDRKYIFGYVTKPWDPKELKSIIREGLERHDQFG